VLGEQVLVTGDCLVHPIPASMPPAVLELGNSHVLSSLVMQLARSEIRDCISRLTLADV